jgi:hypothetical protein
MPLQVGRGKDVNLVLLCVNSQSELQQHLAHRTYTSPLWTVHPKGAKSEVKESDLKHLLWSRGFVDTNVASVLARLTALRFVQRKREPKRERPLGR